ncbi:hypothetical protein REPUB_Repub09cG0096300 [Reevesia pubescens]
MGCVTTTKHVGGSQVLGVILRALVTKNVTRKTIGEEIMVSCIHEHMNIMMENVDAFIALPGGFGALEEIFQVAS